MPLVNRQDPATPELEANRQPGQIRNETGVELYPVYGIVYNNTSLPEAPGVGHQYHSVRRARPAKDAGRSIEYPVPSPIRNAIMAEYRDTDEIGEFTHMRYTPATCGPNNFTLRNGYTLRPRILKRHTQLLTKIVLCLAIDGPDACDQGVLDVLATVGVYQHGVLEEAVSGRDTQAHILLRPMDGEHHSTLPPVQVILCLKTQNNGKINSHRWFLNTFGRILNPEVVVHVDTGTLIDPNSLLELWNAFYNNQDLGGACGLIRPYVGVRKKLLLSPLVASQNFEYNIACQLERALESTTGYLSVLPGAFSAYRYKASKGRPLESYFQGDPTLAGVLGKRGTFTSVWKMNRFLADDRILSFEICIKAGQKWHTRLVSSAGGETDCPESTIDFINQRRRWLNGSLSASLYSLRMTWRLFSSGHNILRMTALFVQMLYNLLALLIAWFYLAGYLLTTFVINDVTGDPPRDSGASRFPFGAATPIVNAIIQVVYIALMVLQFIFAVGGRPKSHHLAYIISFAIFAFIQCYLLVNLIYLTKRLVDLKTNPDATGSYAYIGEYYSDLGELTVLVTAVATFGIYIAAGILCFDPWHLFHSWAPYLFISSSYNNTLKAYAFSNIQDASWGLKAGKKPVDIVLVPDTNNQSPNPVIENEAESDTSNLQEDIDIIFEATVKRALQPYKAPSRGEDTTLNKNENGSDDDGDVLVDREGAFLKVRTILIATYLFSNFFLCILVMNDSLKPLWWLGDSYWHKIWFFRLWMWGNSVLLGMQFVGCLYQRFVSVFRYFYYVG
ncbi:chitin synthase B [Apiospora marii]|uniref:Chitin synthase n=1 Tax=Apiospora marii TaxID=335849 RepID=A0ABR1T3P5_9PEZI